MRLRAWTEMLLVITNDPFMEMDKDSGWGVGCGVWGATLRLRARTEMCARLQPQGFISHKVFMKSFCKRSF